MEFNQVVTMRRSVRSFHNKPVDDKQLETILKAAIRAPSAGNLQAYKIYVINDRAALESLSTAAYDQEFIAQASLALVFCTDPQRSAWRYRDRGRTLYTVQDATIAACFAMLATTNLGLGSVWVGAFSEDAVRDIVGAPDDFRPIIILPIGHPAVNPPERPRRLLDELVDWH